MENVEKEDKNVYEAYLDEINHETANNLYDIVDNTNIEGLKELKEGQRLVNNPISSTGNQGVLRRIPTAWIVTE